MNKFLISFFIIFYANSLFAQSLSSIEQETIERWQNKLYDLKRSSTDLPKGNKFNNEELLVPTCSLKSSRFNDIYAKTEELVATLKDQCNATEDEGKVKDIAKLVEKFQTELKDKGILDKDQQNLVPTEIDGVKLNLLFNNLNSLVKRGQCRRDDLRLLNVTADVIQDITGLGILSPSTAGLAISGTGAIVATALRLVDSFFKEKFNFDKPKDRASYIKLNCTYFDLRKSLYLNGFFEMDRNSIKEDYDRLITLDKRLTKEVTASKAFIEKLKNQDGLTQLQKDQLKQLATIKESLKKAKESLELKEVESSLPKETVRLKWIGSIATNQVLLEAAIKQYMQFENRPLSFMDDHFVSLVLNFSPENIEGLQKIFNQSFDEFSNGTRAQLLYHFDRVSDEVLKRENKIKGEVVLGDSKEKVAQVLSEITEKEKILVDLKQVIDRMKIFESQKLFERFDDGSENAIGILDNLNEINKKIFGDFGFKFVEYSRQRGNEALDLFNQRVNRFEKKHAQIILDIENKNVAYPEIEANYFCQDLNVIRQNWAYVMSMADLGYDFLALNRDLFNNETFNIYGMRNDEETTWVLTQIEMLQRHYVSAVLAKKKNSGIDLDKSKSKKYLDEKYFGSLMLDVYEKQKEVRKFDQYFEEAQCLKVFNTNL